MDLNVWNFDASKASVSSSHVWPASACCVVLACVCVCLRVRAHLSRIYHSGAGLNAGVVVDLATVVAVVGGRRRGRGFY